MSHFFDSKLLLEVWMECITPKAEMKPNKNIIFRT